MSKAPADHLSNGLVCRQGHQGPKCGKHSAGRAGPLEPRNPDLKTNTVLWKENSRDLSWGRCCREGSTQLSSRPEPGTAAERGRLVITGHVLSFPLIILGRLPGSGDCGCRLGDGEIFQAFGAIAGKELRGKDRGVYSRSMRSPGKQ